MFASFSTAPHDHAANNETSRRKPKRHQVSRACAWCRTYRIKCDAKFPCRNCNEKGRKCTGDQRGDQIRTFPSAIKEIERLRARVRELEDQVRGLEVQPRSLSQSVNLDNDPPIKEEERNLPEELDPLGQHGSNRKYYNWSFATRMTPHGSGQAYGASSTFYFVDQLASFMDAVKRESQPFRHRSPVDLPSSLLLTLRDSLAGVENTQDESTDVTEDLTRAEEERLFAVYWDNYDLLYPVLEKGTFEDYYQSLWTGNNASRTPSALVDILLAFCMQHDAVEATSTLNARHSLRNCPSISVAGRWFFRRCQYFLQDELQEPTIMTFQSYALSVFWLSQASWQNAAQNLLAATLRVGVVLGLHIEPSPSTPKATCAFRRRLWWTMYSIDAQYAMEYGRPISVNFGQITCALPKDDDAAGEMHQSQVQSSSFSTQYISLILATRAIYILFYQECARVLHQNGKSDLREDPKGLETCAHWLESKTRFLQAWVQHVPDHMKPHREGLGQAYSIDRSRLDLNMASDKNSRHRILLEILYHTWAMSLYRPFISFAKPGAKAQSMTEKHAASCANHAIALTNIIHQVIHEMDCMRAWHSICVNQLRAALTLVGYIVAYPHGPVALVARQGVDTAMRSFRLLGQTFSRAGMAAVMLREVSEQVDQLLAGMKQATPNQWQQDATAAASNLKSPGFLAFDTTRHELQPNVESNGSHQATWPSHGALMDNLASQDWLDVLLDFGHEAEQ